MGIGGKVGIGGVERPDGNCAGIGGGEITRDAGATGARMGGATGARMGGATVVASAGLFGAERGGAGGVATGRGGGAKVGSGLVGMIDADGAGLGEACCGFSAIVSDLWLLRGCVGGIRLASSAKGSGRFSRVGPDDAGMSSRICEGF